MAVEATTIVWNQEKADILAQVIDRSRDTDSGGADWKGLADHLQVPLSYLLYRIQARYEEELQGLKDVRSALGPATPTNARPFPSSDRTSLVARATSRLTVSSRLSSSGRLSTPLGVRARLASMGHRPSSSSTTTIQATKYGSSPFRPQPTIVTSSDSEEDSADEENGSEEAEKAAEEQESLDKRLQALQRMMTSEALGLVSSPRSTKRSSDSIFDRGREGTPLSARVPLSSRSTSTSASQSISSSASSPPGSIPSIPSPPSDSPMSRHLSPSKSSSPPALSPRSARGQSHLRLDAVMRQDSEQGSQGSETSSFSDISDASLSASALESALSNIRVGNSRLSTFTRNGLTGRGGVYQ